MEKITAGQYDQDNAGFSTVMMSLSLVILNDPSLYNNSKNNVNFNAIIPASLGW